MARVTEADVRAVLLDNYGARGDGTSPDLTAFIRRASVLIDRVVTCATSRGYTLSTEELDLLEATMAAHYYTKADPVYASRSTADASASFVRDPKTPEPYKAMAIDLDPSGCLEALLERKSAGAFWMGRPPSDQTDYTDRD